MLESQPQRAYPQTTSLRSIPTGAAALANDSRGAGAGLQCSQEGHLGECGVLGQAIQDATDVADGVAVRVTLHLGHELMED